jgi:hypothetical protein
MDEGGRTAWERGSKSWWTSHHLRDLRVGRQDYEYAIRLETRLGKSSWRTVQGRRMSPVLSCGKLSVLFLPRTGFYLWLGPKSVPTPP